MRRGVGVPSPVGWLDSATSGAHGPFVLQTDRLILRDWRDADFEPWVEMNQDPVAMAFFPALYDRERCAASMAKIRDHLAREGFGLWAVERIGGPAFLGFVGLKRVEFTARFAPAIEIGWRLARACWGQGYATEAGRACLHFAFGALGLSEVVAMLVPANRRSAHVAERLGMWRDPHGDFMHPQLTRDAISVGGHALQPHALYRIDRATWGQTATSSHRTGSTDE